MKRTTLSQREIDTSFQGEHINTKYPPIMTIVQVAEMLQVSRSSMYRRLLMGSLDFAKTRQGRGARFYRDRVLKWYFNER